MTYAMSDLHGRYDLYIKMLEKINFSEGDTLYILGDFVDRGDEGLKIVLDIAERDNVVGLMGNHDFLALSIISNLDRALKPGQLEDMRYLIDMWKMDGGTATYNEYKKLSLEKRKVALMTIDGFRNYAEVKIGEREFVLVHGGIPEYNAGMALYEYKIDDLVFTREDYGRAKFGVQGKYLVTGHTPTATIEGAIEGRIYKNHDHIAIDCGAAYGYGLGCLCLNTLMEYYVN